MIGADFWQRFVQNGIDPQHPVASALRWPKWLLACKTGKLQIARFRTGGLKMQLVPKLHSFDSTSIYIKRDYYEPELLKVGQLIEPGSTALDIGGSFGIFALFMAHFAGPSGKVHSFEPGEFSFAQLTANVALNDMEPRITTHRMAASDKAATLRLDHNADSPVNFSVGHGQENWDSEAVRAERVVDVVPAEDAARVSFIKIDVEGYEMAALEGARSILEAQHPAIMIEISAGALARQQQVPADMYAYLASYGYDFFILDQGHFVPVTRPLEGNIFAAVTDLSVLSS